MGFVLGRVLPAVKRVMALQLPDRAAGLAYYAFLAIPALLLLALGVLGLVYDPAGIRDLVARAGGVLPAEAVSLLQDSLAKVASGSANGITLIAVSVPMALWTASGAMNALMRALNAIHGVQETRGFARQRLVAMGMLAWTLLAMVLVVGLLVLGPVLSAKVGDAAGSPGVVTRLWWTAQWPILLGALMLAFTGILGLGPDLPVRRQRRSMLAGAAVATVLWLALSAGFSLFVSRFGSYDQAWGPLSVVVITLVWMWLSALALLIGAAVDTMADDDGGRAPRHAAPY